MGGGLIWEGGGAYLIPQKMIISVPHKELECKMWKLKYKYKNLEVIEPRIKHKSKLPAGE